jgi:RND family efflux transporter MFP subunit
LQGQEAVVAATSSGIVSFAGSFTEGEAVAKGQTIVTISAQSIVDGDPAARAKIEYETAEREYRRAEELVVDQIISQKDFNEAERRYETARAALPAGATRAGMRVTSPVSGYIKNHLVGSGEYVSAGQSIVTITQTGKLQLRAEVSERWFGALPTITGANFKTPYSDTVHRADRLLSYGRTVDDTYIPVLFEFADVGGGVIPGAYAEVWLLGAPMQNVLSVPKSAITEEQGSFFVYTRLDEEGYEKREVALGADNGERIQILDGLKPGEQVVTRGATQVRLAAMSGIIPEGHSH